MDKCEMSELTLGRILEEDTENNLQFGRLTCSLYISDVGLSYHVKIGRLTSFYRYAGLLCVRPSIRHFLPPLVDQVDYI